MILLPMWSFVITLLKIKRVMCGFRLTKQTIGRAKKRIHSFSSAHCLRQCVVRRNMRLIPKPSRKIQRKRKYQARLTGKMLLPVVKPSNLMVTLCVVLSKMLDQYERRLAHRKFNVGDHLTDIELNQIIEDYAKLLDIFAAIGERGVLLTGLFLKLDNAQQIQYFRQMNPKEFK